MNDAYEMVLTVATKCCPLLETFKANGFSCLDTVPDGIADADTTEEFATLVGVSRRVLPAQPFAKNLEQQSVYSHVERRRSPVIASAYATLVTLYPDQRRALNLERKSSLAKLHASPNAIMLGQQFGARVAADILIWRSTDGFEPEPPPFWGGTNIGQWRPTPPDFRPGASP